MTINILNIIEDEHIFVSDNSELEPVIPEIGETILVNQKWYKVCKRLISYRNVGRSYFVDQAVYIWVEKLNIPEQELGITPSFVSPLQENLANEDIEEEFNRFLDDTEGTPKVRRPEEQLEWGMDIARHFANWQKDKDKVEMLILKDQIESCLAAMKCKDELLQIKMKEQKQQMMKDAVSGKVGQTINGMLKVLSDEFFGDLGFKAGDKVKLIIIKEE